MANNRMWLAHRPTGEAVYLGKRMGYGWYDATADLGARVEAFYQRCGAAGAHDSQDDFILVMEDARGAPACTNNWVWESADPPKGRPKGDKASA